MCAVMTFSRLIGINRVMIANPVHGQQSRGKSMNSRCPSLLSPEYLHRVIFSRENFTITDGYRLPTVLYCTGRGLPILTGLVLNFVCVLNCLSDAVSCGARSDKHESSALLLRGIYFSNGTQRVQPARLYLVVLRNASLYCLVRARRRVCLLTSHAST